MTKVFTVLIRGSSPAAYELKTSVIVILGSLVNLYVERKAPIFVLDVILIFVCLLMLIHSLWKLNKQGSL